MESLLVVLGGTSVEYIQVHNNIDDCVKFFGGTVDAKHLICTGADDDNLDIVGVIKEDFNTL